MEDYTKYLSYDNGKGILLKKEDKEILDRYHIDYNSISNIDMLMYEINECLEIENDDELESVLIHLSDFKYYNYTKK